MRQPKLMAVFGTRPEAIKLAPVIREAKGRDTVDMEVVVTAQHREMLDDVLEAFNIQPDRDLNIMVPGQSLFQVTARIIEAMDAVLRESDPDTVIIQGDTTTAFVAALSAYYLQKKVAHVEAGLRTGDRFAPFPEEANRRMAACLTDFHFAPTEAARQNLLRENIPAASILVTGNTVIDALLWMKDRVTGIPCPVPEVSSLLYAHEKMVLITGHRRENFGEPFRQICSAFRRLAKNHPETLFIYPVHLNPNVQRPVQESLDDLPNFHLLPPLSYPKFVWFLQRADFLITDSGGIQEEAPALGKPVLVTREKTERPEAVEAGTVKLVGHDEAAIVAAAEKLLADRGFYDSMARGISPYGDGKASARILDELEKAL